MPNEISIASRRTALETSSIDPTVAAEYRIRHGADPVQELPKPGEGSSPLDALAATRRKKVVATSLHVQIPIDMDLALSRAMRDKGLEKTAIVIAALRPFLAEYLA